MAGSDIVKIGLIGYDREQVHALTALLKRDAAATVDEPLQIEASAHDVLSTVLADTTLIAQIAGTAATAVEGVAKIVAVVKQWTAREPSKPGQSVTIKESD